MDNKQPVREPTGEQPVSNENRAGEPSPCQLTLTEFIVRKNDFLISMGDIFGTANELVYIPLASATYTGIAIGIGALVVGGVLAGITANSANQQRLESARNSAAETREKDFGKSLEERVREHEGLVIPRKNIISISVNNRFAAVIEIVHGYGSLAISTEDDAAKAANACRKLESWRLGNLSGEIDTQGVNLGLPPAERVLGWLQDGSIRSNTTGEMLEAILLQPAYLEAMLKQFGRSKKPKKVAILNTVRALPEDWVNMFRRHLGGFLIKGMRNQRWALIALVVSILSTIFYFSSTFIHLEAVNHFPLFCTMYGVFGLFFSIAFLIIAIVENRKTRDLLAIFAARGPGTPEIS